MKIERFPFTQILGWSVSRYDKFSSCKRQYYYDYYGKYDSQNAAAIMRLKAMTSGALEVGTITHDVIAKILGDMQPSRPEVNRLAMSMDVNVKVEELKKRIFSEVYYEMVPVIDFDELAKKVYTCVTNFVDSERYAWIVKNALPFKKDWIIEPAGYGETRISGMKAYCKVDYLFPVEDTLFIMDWKTGKPNQAKHSRQMAGYTLWATYHSKCAPEKISTVVAYLHPLYQEDSFFVPQKDVDEFAKTVASETAEMRAMLSDVQGNTPKDKKEFTQTENKNACKWCNYRELCNKEIQNGT